jgi:hypothetical protein
MKANKMPTGEYELPPLSEFTVTEKTYHEEDPIMFGEWMKYYWEMYEAIPNYAYDHPMRKLYINKTDKPEGKTVVDEDGYETIYTDDDPYDHVLRN